MGSTELISIIIPVYNVRQDYFFRCISSIKNQTYKSYECLIIDDGSTRNNEENYKKALEYDTRFKYIKQENAGVSAARNRGIKCAKGDYVCFIDADDTVDFCFLEQSCEIANKYNCDIVFGDIQNVPEDIQENLTDEIKYIGSDSLEAVRNDFISLCKNQFNFRTVHGSVCSKLIKAEVLNKHKFDIKIPYSEDLLFTRELLADANSIVICPNRWYYYYQNQDSATHSRPCIDYEKLYTSFWNRWHELNMTIREVNVLKRLYQRNIDFYYTFIKLHVLNDKSGFTAKCKLLKRVCGNKIFSAKCYGAKIVDYKDFDTRVKFFLMNQNLVGLSYLIMKIKNKLKCGT